MGLSCEESKITGTVVGTPLYMAPEVITRGIYDRRADLFSLGLILWEIYYGKCVDNVYRVTNLAQFPKLAFKKNSDPLFKSLILSCVTEKPDARTDITDCNNKLAKYVQQLQY